MGEKLDALLRSGVTHVASFVPWQAVESDISHSLPRFLQALHDRKMTVSLLLSPEVGVHYANSGLPKSLFAKPETLAKTPSGEPVIVGLPPNTFALPSLLAPEFTKRYQNFLSRIDALLADLEHSQPDLLEGVTAVLSGSLWKYYRSPRSAALQTFAGANGDHSNNAAVSYRQCLEQFYAQREFSQAGTAAVNRWKTRQLESLNRRWFSQQAEDVFRLRSAQFVRKRAVQLRVQQIELFTPEADPAFAYSQFVQLVSGGSADFSKLSSLIDDASARASGVNGAQAPSYVHWTGLGSFRTLSDAEKQFLILKSLLLMGGRSGGILIDEAEWFSLSHGFRSRAEALARAIADDELRLANRALYLVPHLWSGIGPIWDELSNKLGSGARIVASLDLALQDAEAQLLMVDPSCILTRKSVLQLIEWAKTGRVVVFPRTPLYSDGARAELERTLQDEGTRRGTLEINLGVSYQLYPLAGGLGRLVVFDLPEGSAPERLAQGGEAMHAWQTFVSSVLSVAGLESYCSVSDGRLRTVELAKSRGGLGVFVMNATGRAVAGDLFFPGQVIVSDLASSLGSDANDTVPVPPANRFALEVPPRGILPISVDGIETESIEETRAAHLVADITRGSPIEAVTHELPGFDEASNLGNELGSLDRQDKQEEAWS